MMDEFKLSKDLLGDCFQVKVIPNASKNCVKIDELDSGAKLLRVYVTVPPEDGKANEQVIKILAKSLGIAKSSLKISKGLKSRNKTIKIIN